MNEYLSTRAGYQSRPYNDSYAFDAKLVENVIGKLKRGKAGGLDNLTCEHLRFSHTLLPCILAKLFNLMITRCYRRETALQGALQFSPKVEDWNWETTFYGHYRSIFNHCHIIGLKICQIP